MHQSAKSGLQMTPWAYFRGISCSKLHSAMPAPIILVQGQCLTAVTIIISLLPRFVHTDIRIGKCSCWEIRRYAFPYFIIYGPLSAHTFPAVFIRDEFLDHVTYTISIHWARKNELGLFCHHSSPLNASASWICDSVSFIGHPAIVSEGK